MDRHPSPGTGQSKAGGGTALSDPASICGFQGGKWAAVCGLYAPVAGDHESKSIPHDLYWLSESGGKQHLPLLLGEAYHTGRASCVRCPEILRRSPCVRGIGQYDSPPSRQYPQGTERRGAAGPGGPERSRYCGAAKESTLYPAVLLTGGGK